MKHLLCFFKCHRDHLCLHSFPTRRSSDLHVVDDADDGHRIPHPVVVAMRESFSDRIAAVGPELLQDRKSTRLNSSHPSISYAVFCLTKKKAPICDEQ